MSTTRVQAPPVAVVTGATSGIGAAMLLARGTAAEHIRVVPADLGDEQQRGRAAATALAAGHVDILVNNAATVEPLGPTAAVPVAELRRAFELNVIAPAALTAAVLPGLLDAGWGRIVNVSSAIAARPDFMQAWIRQQDPERIGAAAHERFNQNFTEGTLITPGRSAAVLIAHLAGDDTGAIWDVSAVPVPS